MQKVIKTLLDHVDGTEDGVTDDLDDGDDNNDGVVDTELTDD